MPVVFIRISCNEITFMGYLLWNIAKNSFYFSIIRSNLVEIFLRETRAQPTGSHP